MNLYICHFNRSRKRGSRSWNAWISESRRWEAFETNFSTVLIVIKLLAGAMATFIKAADT